MSDLKTFSDADLKAELDRREQERKDLSALAREMRQNAEY